MHRTHLIDRTVSALGITALLTACSGSGSAITPSGIPPASEIQPASSSNYGLLYSFKGGPGDGTDPYAGLAYVKGVFYGTTYYGGQNNNFGIVYSVTLSGAETVLYNFKGSQSNDGASPFGGLINVKGTLYGATCQGGEYGQGNGGTVFSITPSGTENVLHSFLGYDGDCPRGSLVKLNGTLYGTTTGGGANFSGNIFSITPSGTYTVLYNFGHEYSGDGANPVAALTIVKGTLYGTTLDGGANCGSLGCGTVFSINPSSGQETVLHSFGSGSGDGQHPYAALVSVKGTLYGTTELGGTNNEGTVFKITPSGQETVIHSFGSGLGDGTHPYAGLLNVKGTLYGTTYDGGAGTYAGCGGNNGGCGTVFSITPSGKETVLYSFGNTSSVDARFPFAGLIKVKGKLWGTAYNGGTNGNGAVFWLSP